MFSHFSVHVHLSIVTDDDRYMLELCECPSLILLRRQQGATNKNRVLVFTCRC